MSRKPLTIALEEIEAGKIEAQPLPDEAELAAAADARGSRRGARGRVAPAPTARAAHRLDR